MSTRIYKAVYKLHRWCRVSPVKDKRRLATTIAEYFSRSKESKRSLTYCQVPCRAITSATNEINPSNKAGVLDLDPPGPWYRNKRSHNVDIDSRTGRHSFDGSEFAILQRMNALTYFTVMLNRCIFTGTRFFGDVVCQRGQVDSMSVFVDIVNEWRFVRNEPWQISHDVYA